MRLLIAFLLAFTLVGAEDIYEGDLTADEAYEMQKNGEAIIVDVRTTVEFLYTGHGPRSMAAANRLAKNGITAYNLEDGFIYGWQEEKMPWGGQ